MLVRRKERGKVLEGSGIQSDAGAGRRDLVSFNFFPRLSIHVCTIFLSFFFSLMFKINSSIKSSNKQRKYRFFLNISNYQDSIFTVVPI